MYKWLKKNGTFQTPLKPSNGEDNYKLIVCEETSETKHKEDPIVGKVPLPT